MKDEGKEDPKYPLRVAWRVIWPTVVFAIVMILISEAQRRGFIP